MFKRVLISLSLLTGLAMLVMTYEKNKSDYQYAFPVSNISEEKLQEEFLKQVDFYQKKIKKNNSAKDMILLAQVYVNRAKAVGSSDYFLLASRHAYKSMALMPKYNPGAWYVLADVAQTQKEYQKAISYAHIINKQKNYKTPEAYLIFATSNLGLGNLEAAMVFADELIDVFPSEKAYSLRALILAEQGRDQEAINDFEEAIKLMENDPIQGSYTRAMYARFLLSRPYKKDDYENTIALLNEALRITPASSLVHGLIGDLFVKEKKYKEALKYYQSAFSLSKQLCYLIKEARTQKLSGNSAYAEKLYTQTEILLRMEFNKNRSAYAADLIRMMLERGDPKDYTETMRLAERELILRANSETLHLYSWALEQSGRLQEARKSIRVLLAKNIHSEEVLNRAASIEAKLKNKNLAQIYKGQQLQSRSL